MTTKIEWTGETWNPVTGCTKISEGCANCYAERMVKRLAGRFGYDKRNPFKLTFHADKLDQPLTWKKPRRIFVCSMGDLFHDDVPDEWIDRVIMTIANCPQHTFQVLTKRSLRMRYYFDAIAEQGLYLNAVRSRGDTAFVGVPLPNLWLGVSVENQAAASARIPHLLKTPAAVRFVSIEPMLDELVAFGGWPDVITKCRSCGVERELGEDPRAPKPRKNWVRFCYVCGGQRDITSRIDWVIVGCESGPNRRPCKTEWIEKVVEHSANMFVPCFVKQISIDGRVSHNPAEWPESLRVRQWPGGVR